MSKETQTHSERGNETTNNVQKRMNLSKTQRDVKETLEELHKKKLRLLGVLTNGYFQNRGLSDYCGKGEKQCSDGSNLYILTKEGVAKVGCGEFNSDTFINGPYSRYEKKYIERQSNFKNSPFPLYVVNQNESYFACYDQRIKDLMDNNPKLYLETYSVLTFNPNAEKGKRTAVYNRRRNYEEIQRFHIDENSVLSIDDTILTFMNLYFNDFDKNVVYEYMEYLQSLSIEELRDYAKNSDSMKNPTHKKIWNIIYNQRSYDLVGAGVFLGDMEETCKKIVDSFDTKQQKFTNLPKLRK